MIAAARRPAYRPIPSLPKPVGVSAMDHAISEIERVTRVRMAEIHKSRAREMLADPRILGMGWKTLPEMTPAEGVIECDRLLGSWFAQNRRFNLRAARLAFRVLRRAERSGAFLMAAE